MTTQERVPVWEILRDERDRQDLTNKDLERKTGESDESIRRLLIGGVAEPRFYPTVEMFRALGLSVDRTMGLPCGDAEIIEGLQRELEVARAHEQEAVALRKLLEEQVKVEIRTREELRDAYEYRIYISKDRVIWQRIFIFLLAGLAAVLLVLDIVMTVWFMTH